MNRTKIVTEMILILMLLSFSLVSAAAMGTRDAGVPEPVEMKAEVSEQKSNDTGYPPAGWVTDIREAYTIAQADNKQILINFTGSDWCVWCKKLSKEVFTSPEFKTYADDNLVLLFLDFPNNIDLPEEQIRHNQIISQLLDVKGYPSIWLLDGDFSPAMVTGYRDGGADEYIRHLSEDRAEVSDDERENFRVSFTAAVEANLGPLK